MIVSPWSLLSEAEQLILTPKLAGGGNARITDQLLEIAAERFDQLITEVTPHGAVNHGAIGDFVLTAQNFILHVGGHHQAALWQQIAEFKGFRRSYLELTVRSREDFLRVLRASNFVINREPFWSTHKFDSARAMTQRSHQPSLHFANDRADEAEYGPDYFFVHWDKTSCWFRKSNWAGQWLPGARVIEQLYAAMQHRTGCACPRVVCDYLRQNGPAVS